MSTKVFKMAGPNVPDRFHSTNESEINFFKDKTRNQNTENSTNTWVNALRNGPNQGRKMTTLQVINQKTWIEFFKNFMLKCESVTKRNMSLNV